MSIYFFCKIYLFKLNNFFGKCKSCIKIHVKYKINRGEDYHTTTTGTSLLKNLITLKPFSLQIHAKTKIPVKILVTK